MTLSQSQLRLISSIGVGILVGTSLIVIIPEGIEAVVTTTTASTHSHAARNLETRWNADAVALGLQGNLHQAEIRRNADLEALDSAASWPLSTRSWRESKAREEGKKQEAVGGAPPSQKSHEEEGHKLPTFYIGFALTAGFVVMFLIDRLPRHATETLQAAPATRHISLDDLAASSVSGEEETDGFLSSLTPTPKQSRSLATTTGLVIHATADGIAMGASATTADMKLGFIIFAAIMIHKAPAAFGLTSLLLKQGLSKRAARGHLIIFSLAAPFGALATYLIISLMGGGNMEGEAGQWWTGMLLLFSGGTFL
jgi:zinc transporter 9